MPSYFARRAIWIHILDTLAPKGLNEGFDICPPSLIIMLREDLLLDYNLFLIELNAHPSEGFVLYNVSDLMGSKLSRQKRSLEQQTRGIIALTRRNVFFFKL